MATNGTQKTAGPIAEQLEQRMEAHIKRGMTRARAMQKVLGDDETLRKAYVAEKSSTTAADAPSTATPPPPSPATAKPPAVKGTAVERLESRVTELMSHNSGLGRERAIRIALGRDDQLRADYEAETAEE